MTALSRYLCASLLAFGGGAGALFGGGCGSPGSPKQASPADSATLYERLGGVETLRVLVDEWMLEVTSDSRIRDYFVDADIAQLKLRLVERICVQVEGPCTYRGRDMYEVHGDLQLEDRHLRAFMDGLDAAMQRLPITGDLAEELHQAVAALAAELAIDII